MIRNFFAWFVWWFGSLFEPACPICYGMDGARCAARQDAKMVKAWGRFWLRRCPSRYPHSAVGGCCHYRGHDGAHFNAKGDGSIWTDRQAK